MKQKRNYKKFIEKRNSIKALGRAKMVDEALATIIKVVEAASKLDSEYARQTRGKKLIGQGLAAFATRFPMEIVSTALSRFNEETHYPWVLIPHKLDAKQLAIGVRLLSDTDDRSEAIAELKRNIVEDTANWSPPNRNEEDWVH